MISGKVTNNGEATIRLKLLGPTGIEKRISAIIDTGYDGWLTLPPELIAELVLPWSTVGQAVLADGSEIEYDVYEARVVWDRRQREVDIDESDTAPLIGMAMLRDCELNMVVQPHGKITITRLTSGRDSESPRR